MLGHRGCRLGIVYPEITEMQARAIFEAAVDVAEGGHRGRAGDHDPAGQPMKELKDQTAIVRPVADEVFDGEGPEGEVPGRHDDRDARAPR